MLQTPSDKVTLVQGSSMGPGAEQLVSHASMKISDVFSSRTTRDMMSTLMSRGRLDWCAQPLRKSLIKSHEQVTDSRKFKAELKDAENAGSRAAELLEAAIHNIIKPKTLRNKDIRLVVHVYADLTTLHKQRRFAPMLGRRPGVSADVVETFFMEFTERFPGWTLDDMRSERGVEVKLMGKLVLHPKLSAHDTILTWHE
jgi:hypothetical protein